MSRVVFFSCVLAFVYATNAENVTPVDLNKVIISTLEMAPVLILDQPGDWYEIQYGQKKDLLRREVVTVMKTETPEDSKFSIVGFRELPNENIPKKHKLVSYAGNEKVINDLGTKEVDSVDLLDPKEFAAKFGWKI